MARRTTPTFPSRDQDKVTIRLPDGMRDRIQRAASAHGLSVNSELVLLLGRTYPAEPTIDECVREIAEIIAKRPAASQNEAWDSVLHMIEVIRSEGS